MPRKVTKNILTRIKLFHNFIKKNIKKHLHSGLPGADLNNKTLVYINGKPYIKVKLRIVDIMDNKTEMYLDKLESIIDQQRIEIQKLLRSNEEFKYKINDIHNWNINEYFDDKLIIERQINEISGLKAEIESKNLKISEYDINLLENFNSIEELRQIIITLEKDLKIKDYEIAFLNKKILELKMLEKKIQHYLEELSYLRKHIKEIRKELSVKDEKISEKERFILTLTQQILELKRKSVTNESTLSDKITTDTNKIKELQQQLEKISIANKIKDIEIANLNSIVQEMKIIDQTNIHLKDEMYNLRKNLKEIQQKNSKREKRMDEKNRKINRLRKNLSDLNEILNKSGSKMTGAIPPKVS